jgi:hypothetical protein
VSVLTVFDGNLGDPKSFDSRVSGPGDSAPVGMFSFKRGGRILKRSTSGDDSNPFGLPSGLALDSRNRILSVVNIAEVRVPRVSVDRPKAPR